MEGMSPRESRLLPDGRVFPPVTPDPPAPPGQEEIVVPDLIFRSDAADGDIAASAEPTAPAEGEPGEPPG